MRGDVYIAGRWAGGEGDPLESTDPGSGRVLHRLRAATPSQVEAAVAAARRALPGWSATTLEARAAILRRYAELVRAEHEPFAEALALETGKPLWEARTEVDATIAKVEISIAQHAERRAETTGELGDAVARTRFRPIGVLAVLGPFNLPAHLPNGHLVPALLAGNTVVLKPSELTPGIGARLVEVLERAELPPGVVNLVQGGRAVGEALVGAEGVDGVLFTGSYAGGRAIARALADRPERQLALEMGGNNPLVVDAVEDLDAAVVHTLLSAYVTAGQRCTCARRLILVGDDLAERFVDRLVPAIEGIRVGLQRDDPQPFVGPLIDARAAERLLSARDGLVEAGARELVPLRRDPRSPALLHPGLLEVAAEAERPDVEHFGPLLQLVRVPDLEAAIEEANRTAYGLAAALLSDDPARFERFVAAVRAGVVNWNRQTTGASGRLPFGGLGRSGNHRPAGAWSADYCSDPVASLEASALRTPESLPPGLPRGAVPDRPPEDA